MHRSVVVLMLLFRLGSSFRGFAKKATVPRSTRRKAVEDVVDTPPLPKGTSSVSFENEMSKSFMRYALSTIMGRALPDARDGLKPVHRRILHGTRALGLRPGSKFSKCAKVVGDVLGKYHPHGDSSIYDALVRMAQDFVMSERLIDGHGNFGSVDADPPAAMRYTECRLTSFAYDALLNPADYGTSDEISVDLYDNFDGSEKEPRVLPARVPVLLVNGAAGIAVGMATSIPPHNLGEVCDAALLVANAKGKNIEYSDKDLTKAMPAPDFPTGGILVGTEGVSSMYSTGKGGIVIRAKSHIETPKNKKNTQIVVTELPYQVPKAELLKTTAELVEAKAIEGISDIRDESGRDGMRVVYVLKRDANAEVVMNTLLKKTRLQTLFSANIVAIEDNGNSQQQPNTLTLRSCLEGWLSFRFDCVRRRTAYNENKQTKKLHVVDGLILARSRVDEVVAEIRGAATPADAKAAIISKFGLSEIQAAAVLDLSLSRLTRIETKKLEDEANGLRKSLGQLRRLLENDAAVYELIATEVSEIKKKFAKPRRTQVLGKAPPAFRAEDVIENSRSAVLVARGGYVKRVPIREFSAQSRGGRGKAALAGQRLEHVVSCRDHDTLVCISRAGIAYGVKAFDIPMSARTAKGTPLPRIVKGLPASDNTNDQNNVGLLSGLVALSEDSPSSPGEYLVLLTKNGLIKKMQLDWFRELRKSGISAIDIAPDDSLGWAKICSEDDDILVAGADGKVLRFPASDVRMTGRQSKGMNAMKNEGIVTMEIVSSGKEHVLLLTENGYGKRVAIADIQTKRRAGAGVNSVKFKSNDDKLAGLCCCAPGDEVVISTKRGVIIRVNADDISLQSKAATGVMVQRPDSERAKKSDKIAQVSVIPTDLKEEQRNLADEDDDNEASLVNHAA